MLWVLIIVTSTGILLLVYYIETSTTASPLHELDVIRETVYRKQLNMCNILMYIEDAVNSTICVSRITSEMLLKQAFVILRL